jgi:hypothetical protein
MGRAYYVAPNGVDGNPGTLDRPWRTIQRAFDTLQPGEQAYVRAGTYSANVLVTRSGAPRAPITVRSYPGETVVLEPGAGGDPDNFPVEFASATYVRLQGFVIEGANGDPLQSDATDVYAEGGSHHLEIFDCELRSSQNHGFYSDPTTHDLQLLGNTFHDNGSVRTLKHDHAIYVEGTRQLIANNVVYGQPNGFSIQIYPSADHVIVTNNTIVDNAPAGIAVGGDGTTAADNVTIVNNIVAFNAQMGVRSFFPVPPVGVGNQAFTNVGFGNPQGDFSTWQGGGIDYSLGNLVADPLFVDGGQRDYHLQPGSPALGAADPRYAPSTNRDGEPRGPTPNIGAY